MVLDTDELRCRLVSRREELRRRATRIEADKRRENDPLSPDFADQATQRENDAVVDAIGESTGRELQLLERALQRLDAGRYGFCSRCGEAIQSTRLATVPYTDQCSGCAR